MVDVALGMIAVCMIVMVAIAGLMWFARLR